MIQRALFLECLWRPRQFFPTLAWRTWRLIALKVALELVLELMLVLVLVLVLELVLELMLELA